MHMGLKTIEKADLFSLVLNLLLLLFNVAVIKYDLDMCVKGDLSRFVLPC